MHEHETRPQAGRRSPMEGSGWSGGGRGMVVPTVSSAKARVETIEVVEHFGAQMFQNDGCGSILEHFGAKVLHTDNFVSF